MYVSLVGKGLNPYTIMYCLIPSRRQLEWQKNSSTSAQRIGEPDFRERLRKKDLEIAEQLDKMEVHRN